MDLFQGAKKTTKKNIMQPLKISVKEKLNYIKGEFNKIERSTLFKQKECITERLNYYKNLSEKLDKFPFEKLKKFDFKKELINCSILKEKNSLFAKVEKKVYRLERHSFAPEINKLNFINKKGQIIEVSAPKKITIENAIKHYLSASKIIDIKTLISQTKNV